MPEMDIIINSTLTEEDKCNILSAYRNRDTTDSPWTDFARQMMGKPPATENDEDWIMNRVWHRLPDGRIRKAE